MVPTICFVLGYSWETEVVSKVKAPCPIASLCRVVFKKKIWANIPAVVL